MRSIQEEIGRQRELRGQGQRPRHPTQTPELRGHFSPQRQTSHDGHARRPVAHHERERRAPRQTVAGHVAKVLQMRRRGESGHQRHRPEGALALSGKDGVARRHLERAGKGAAEAHAVDHVLEEAAVSAAQLVVPDAKRRQDRVRHEAAQPQGEGEA